MLFGSQTAKEVSTN